jgi:hypothetical protein
VDERVHSEPVQVIRTDIWPRLVSRSKNVENEIISEKILGVYLKGIFSNTAIFSKECIL